MRRFTIAAATLAIAAVFSAAPASADRIKGGPLQQNGQCWQGKNHSSPVRPRGDIGDRARKRRAAPDVEGEERHQLRDRHQLEERHQLRRRPHDVGSEWLFGG